MNSIRITALLLFAGMLGNAFVAPSASALAEAGPIPARHFKLVNATFDSVTALAIAPADDQGFHAIPLGQPLQGGLTAMTFDVPAGGCLRDLRVTFRDGRSRVLPHVDVCRSSGLRLGPQAGGSKPG